MPYSSQAEVEFWGQFTVNSFANIPDTWNYPSRVQQLINIADGEIDEYVNMPKGFFEAGGIVVDREYHSGKHLPSGIKPLLTPKYTPVLSVVKLEYYANGAWSTQTETTDYIVMEDGLYLLSIPSRSEYKNIRLTYRCGYELTPQNVSQVSARLAAAIGNLILDTKDRLPVSTGGVSFSPPEISSLIKTVFTDNLKKKLDNYRTIQVLRG